MTKRLQRLHDELVRRHCTTTTRDTYIKFAKAFQDHASCRLDRISPDDLRRYQLFRGQPAVQSGGAH